MVHRIQRLFTKVGNELCRKTDRIVNNVEAE